MQITVNGQERHVGEGTSLMDLLTELNVDTKTVVVQRNADIVGRSDFVTTSLTEGDVLELVRLVGGG